MILVNGNLTDSVLAMDRGLAYGDGLFETIAAHQSGVLLWDLHWQRLQSGCHQLKIDCPEETLIRGELQQLLKHAEMQQWQRCVVKIIITRGAGGRGYRPDPNLVATRILMLNNWPDYPDDYYKHGVECRVCDTRMSSQPALAGIKHLNRLEHVLARMEWNEPHIAEGIMLDMQGNVIEGTMSNIFFVTPQGEIETPSLEYSGVRGVQRENVIGIAKERNIPVRSRVIGKQSLDQYSEAFLTNSLIGIWPIRSIDGDSFKPGSVTRLLQQVLTS
jgi:4-amino-4-deoxychorismate lyase